MPLLKELAGEDDETMHPRPLLTFGLTPPYKAKSMQASLLRLFRSSFHIFNAIIALCLRKKLYLCTQRTM